MDNRKSSPKRFVRYFDYVRPEVMQRLKNNLAKAYNAFEKVTKGHHVYDEIGQQSDIFLGIIPTVDLIKELEVETSDRGKNVTIISIVDVFEFTSGVGTIRPKDCQKNGWHHYHLPMTDYTPDMEMENIIAAAKAIHEAKLRGDIVYIHCKAGKARSAMILAVYFALYDDAFRQTLDQTVLNAPHLLLKSAIDHIKKCRSQVDLHNELIDKLNTEKKGNAPDQWERLLTDQQGLEEEIEQTFSKKDIFGKVHKANIGKLCNAYNAIAGELQKKLAVTSSASSATVPASDKKTDYSYHSEHFLNAFVQSAAYKELVILAWEIKKNALKDPVRIEYLDAFLQLLINDPAAAIVDLENGFLHRDQNTNVGRLLNNSKSAQIIDIIERLFVGVRHYDVYHVFEATLVDKVRFLYGDKKANQLEGLLKDKSMVQYVHTSPDNVLLFDHLTKCCQSMQDAEMQHCFAALSKIQHNKNDIRWVLNLDRACELYHFYQQSNAPMLVRQAAFECIGYPFGVMFAKLNDRDMNDQLVISSLMKLRANCLSELDRGVELKNALIQIADLMPKEVRQFAASHSTASSIAATPSMPSSSASSLFSTVVPQVGLVAAPPPRPSAPLPQAVPKKS